MFVKAQVIHNEERAENLPLLVDCGATNSCLSWVTLQLLGYTKQDICTEVQYSLSNVTEHENPHSIIGSVLMDVELESQSKHSILSVQFLILELDIPYGIGKGPNFIVLGLQKHDKFFTQWRKARMDKIEDIRLPGPQEFVSREQRLQTHCA